jgi:hypothetical protein
MTYVPNPQAVLDTAENMITRTQPGGGKQTIDDACWWAWEHAFAYDSNENGHKFWRAVYDVLDQKRRNPKPGGGSHG